MKIVIQCAATKHHLNPDCGLRSNDNLQIKFVAIPKLISNAPDILFVRPDDIKDNSSETWRDYRNTYNKLQNQNPLKLLPAYKLYKHPVYEDLVKKFGIKNVFILSAGWGLISAEFLTPDYDITFSNAKNIHPSRKRKKGMEYRDLCHLPDNGDSIIFLGGKDYLPLFCNLTLHMRGRKIIFFNSVRPPILSKEFNTLKYETTQKTNWHYSCARDLINGLIHVGIDDL